MLVVDQLPVLPWRLGESTPKAVLMAVATAPRRLPVGVLVRLPYVMGL